MNYLQRNTDQEKEFYTEKRNLAKSMIRKAHQESCNKFIRNIENDIHGRQTLEYKILRKLKKEEKDDADINVIHRKNRVKLYRSDTIQMHLWKLILRKSSILKISSI